MRIHEDYAGIFTLSAFKIDDNGDEIPGTRREPVPPFKNLITDAGLNRMGAPAGNYLYYCQVGSGSSTPNVLDTALGSWVAGSINTPASIGGCTSVEPYYTWVRTTRRFLAGVAAGNLSEVGMGWLDKGGLFSRALILDAVGNPTTITILTDEVLDVTYELRCYPKITDSTGTLVATGNLGGTYDYIMRASNVTTYQGSNGWAISSVGTPQSSTWICITSNGAIGPVTGTPTGATSSNIPQSLLAYSSGSYEQGFLISMGLNDSNLVGGIRSVFLKMGIGYYQCQFDPPIPKTLNDELTLTLKHSWARRP